MSRIKLARCFSAVVLFLLIGRPAAAQSLNWVHQATGITGPPDDIAIGFTGPWVNVFYNIGVGENIEVRGIRQFPVANPNNNLQYVPYPMPLTTVPSTVDVQLRAVSSVSSFGVEMPEVDVALTVRDRAAMHPAETFLISAANPTPDALPGVEAAAFRPNGQLVTFDSDDLNSVGIVAPECYPRAGATDLDVALVDAPLVDAQNNIYEIHYRQTTFGTGQFLPPVVVASVPGLNPDSVDFAMTDGGIPHIVYSDPGMGQVISRQFDPKVNAWTTDVLSGVFGIVGPSDSVASRGELVAATWADANPNNPQAPELDLRVAIREGSGPWNVSTVCTACVGNPEQLDITFSPDGFPVIAYVSPTNQLMVAFDPLLPQPPLGDFNGDGSVDAADYVAWRKTDGSQIGYDTWRANFGRSASDISNAAAQNAVPEPCSLVMLLAGGTLTVVAAWREPGRRVCSLSRSRELFPIDVSIP